MIFLLNKERVLAEVGELARLHISGILKVKPEFVSVQFELVDGKIKPRFDVKTEVSGAWEQDYIQNTMQSVWSGWAKEELVNRLMGLEDVRFGFQKDSPNPDSEEETEGEEEGQ